MTTPTPNVRQYFEALRNAMLTCPVESTGASEDMPTAYQHVVSLAQFEKNPGQRVFTVQNTRTRPYQQVQATGVTGRGSYFLRLTVFVKHINRAAEGTDFEAFLAQEHRRIMDWVLNLFRMGDARAGTVAAPVVLTGYLGIDDEGVLVDDEPENSFEVNSVFQFRLLYRDTICYP